MITKEKVLEALGYVDDPDLKKDLVTLKMIEDVHVEGKKVAFTVVLTTPACPLKEMIKRACENAIKHYVDAEAEVVINMTSRVTSPRVNADALAGVKNIIAVASGKGGVGKSTVAVNVAVALAREGARVGMVDADIYGPSLPIMLGAENEKLFVHERNGQPVMVPVERHGVKMLSIGFMADPSKAIVWRGPMASKALKQLFNEAEWGELDYLIVDLPPGTGDIHITLVSSLPVTGALVVSTPQHVALADAIKGVDMFRHPNINVPVLGLVENMAYFVPDDLPEKKYYIFGREGCRKLAETIGVPFLGEVPIVQSIREGGDAGVPVVANDDSEPGKAFMSIARNLAQQVAVVNANLNKEKEPVNA